MACPPCKRARKYMVYCFQTDEEAEITVKAEELFGSVNVDKGGGCLDMIMCQAPKLSKSEIMLLLRILRDEKRSSLRNEKVLVDKFADRLKEAHKDDSEAGHQITMDEFTSSLLGATAEYMKVVVDLMAHECTDEYSKMDADLAN